MLISFGLYFMFVCFFLVCLCFFKCCGYTVLFWPGHKLQSKNNFLPHYVTGQAVRDEREKGHTS